MAIHEQLERSPSNFLYHMIVLPSIFLHSIYEYLIPIMSLTFDFFLYFLRFLMTSDAYIRINKQGCNQGCQIFRFLRKISAFRLFFRIFSAVPLFSAFREFFDALSINRFQETIRKKRIFLGKSMTITMQSLQNHWKEIDMENFLRRSRKDSTYQP